MKILVSACLNGKNVKYSGGNNLSEQVINLADEFEIVEVCPEMLGGLPCPRKPGEIKNGVVVNADGTSVDYEYKKGAEIALNIAEKEETDFAVLQSRSPSCGVNEIYDGTFSKKKIPGPGVFAKAMLQHGFKLIDIEDLKRLKEQLRQNESDYSSLFGESIKIRDGLVRNCDNSLKDMRDHNSFICTGQLAQCDLNAAIELQKSRGEDFVQFCCNEKQPQGFLVRNEEFSSGKETVISEFEQWCEYGMALVLGNPNQWTINSHVKYKRLSEDDISCDLLKLELENFGSKDGTDFTKRKMLRYFDAATAKNRSAGVLDYCAAYIDGQIAGSLYTYKNKDSLCIDNLIVSPQYRNRYIATSLMKYALQGFDGPVFLHADSDDTPKDMYMKMGFIEVDRKYYYLGTIC